ncbi:MAG TPA: restriction endonuclease subunit S, partial [Pseudomonadota bacterium]|nr:restriction endonuclease subunit S [Pseudomonadota bacterium]
MTRSAVPWTLPLSWSWTTIDSVVESSFYGPRFAKDQYVSSGIPTIRTTDMTPLGEIVLRDPPQVRVSDDELARFKLKERDLLITRTGSIGRCAIYRTAIGPALPSAYLIRYRLHQDRCDPEYLVRYLLGPFGQASLGASATAVTQPNINAQAIGSMPFALPPLNEQRRIVAKLDSLQERSRRARDSLDAVPALLDKLRQSILAAAFRGDLTRDFREQHKDLEPASKLLQRIRTERRKKWEEAEL